VNAAAASGHGTLPAGGAASAVAERLRNVVVHLRDDLDTSRHVFRGEPAYIVRDPVTFQSHSLSPDDYAVFVALDADAPLSDTFAALVERGELTAEDEDEFYAFVLSLHRSGLLNLPVSDGKTLFQRFERRVRAKRKSLVMSVFFLRVPLVDPDVFLDRTIGYVRWAFTKWAVLAWAALMAAAILVAWVKRDELGAPLLTVLELQNLPLLWVVLVVLKVFHEFGHAYACKAMGGAVPEMGAFFIVGTPCAYVDATSSWGFPEKSKRIFVSLAGMYVESVFAATALFVWAATDPGLLNSLAFQTALMASVVTIGFNLNPLAKFDGYYILSDAVAIPNLRQRASDELRRVFDRAALGLRGSRSPHGPITRLGLVVFGIASMMYRITLVVGISAMIATKFFLIGIGLAVVYITMSLVGFVMKSLRYLWWAPQTETVRGRAVVVSVLGLALLPAAALFAPVPAAGGAWGTIEHERERVVRAEAVGVLTSASVGADATVSSNQALAELENTELSHDAAVAEAEWRLARLVERQRLGEGAAAARLESERVRGAYETYRFAIARAVALRPVASVPGRVVYAPLAERSGAFVQEGETVAVIVDGARVVELLVDEDLLAGARPRVGDAVRLRASAAPELELIGTITQVAETGSRTVQNATLTQSGVNKIAASPGGGGATEPGAEADDTGESVAPAEAGRAFFRVVVRLPDDAPSSLRRGGSVKAMFTTERVAAGTLLYRRVIRFLNELRSG